MTNKVVSRSCGRRSALWGWFLAGLFLADCQTGKSDPRFEDLPGLTNVPEMVSVAGNTSGEATAPMTPAAQPQSQRKWWWPWGGSSSSPAFTPIVAAPATKLSGSGEVLRAGDQLVITYSDLPITQPPFNGPVRDDGTITLLLNKSFQAVGKTPGELEREIRETYVPAYFKEMTVTVLHQLETRFYFITGEVKMEGKQPYLGPITLTKGISTAGGFSEFANKTSIQLIRQGAKHAEIFNYKKLIKEPTLDPEIFPGDTVHVKRRLF